MFPHTQLACQLLGSLYQSLTGLKHYTAVQGGNQWSPGWSSKQQLAVIQCLSLFCCKKLQSYCVTSALTNGHCSANKLDCKLEFKCRETKNFFVPTKCMALN
ncbi:hypothetical protein ATANTOWER_025793 [Ataeniobius toweri]|uniref:Secreted protein n=1 Tax=Ataeniobius toweri TaxID=208326 RepID=A0ABU7AC97_9TELE|nr:hypothetical protein [Ataeniobius toweri]